jgi:hypothetical protein
MAVPDLGVLSDVEYRLRRDRPGRVSVKEIVVKRLWQSAAVLAVLMAVASCQASANLTVSASSLADQVADGLERDGLKPNIDCGSDAVDLVEGKVVYCTLSVTGDSAEYDVTVTLSDIDGTKYHFDAQVADQPK